MPRAPVFGRGYSTHSFFEEINRFNINFCNLDVKGTFLWLMTNEDHLILNKLGEYLLKNFNKRTKELTSANTKTKQTKKVMLYYIVLYMYLLLCNLVYDI